MLNHVSAMGRLTRDPELRRTQSGIAVCSFSIACERDFKDQAGQKITDFIECVAWRNTAEFVCKYFTKGRMIIVEGSLQSRKWQDRNGASRVSWEVIANSCYFGDSKPSDGQQQNYTGGAYGGYGGQGYNQQSYGQPQNGYGGGSSPQGGYYTPQSAVPPSGGSSAPQGYNPEPTYPHSDYGGFSEVEDDGELPF